MGDRQRLSFECIGKQNVRRQQIIELHADAIPILAPEDNEGDVRIRLRQSGH